MKEFITTVDDAGAYQKAEPVIRCKNCVYFLKEVVGVLRKRPVVVDTDYCEVWDRKNVPNGWCNFGQKKTEGK